jgi:hypothetical protein
MQTAIAEPSGHIDTKEFETTIDLAVKAGLKEVSRPDIASSRAVLLVK